MKRNISGQEGPLVSVLMPTFNQAAFISRALESLLAQKLSRWELVIVDDGSTDETPTVLQPYLADGRIHYYRLDENQGLGAALNHALRRAKAPLVAYLPSDDVYYRDHLESLVSVLNAHEEATLAYSGVRYEFRLPGKGVIDKSSPGQLEDFPVIRSPTIFGVIDKSSPGQLKGLALQLVQVMHWRTDDQWIEREELVTDDLERMFWEKLRKRVWLVATNRSSGQRFFLP